MLEDAELSSEATAELETELLIDDDTALDEARLVPVDEEALPASCPEPPHPPSSSVKATPNI